MYVLVNYEILFGFYPMTEISENEFNITSLILLKISVQ